MVFGVGGAAGCCKADGRKLCEKDLQELATLEARAPGSLRPGLAADHARFSSELAATAPGDAGSAARAALSGRINVALADWDKKVDEALRVAALPLLRAGRWIGVFHRNGAAHLGEHVRIGIDGAFAFVRNERRSGRRTLRTDSGTILGVDGGKLTYKAAGRSNKPATFVVDTPPRALAPSGQLGFLVKGSPYVQVPGS